MDQVVSIGAKRTVRECERLLVLVLVSVPWYWHYGVFHTREPRITEDTMTTNDFKAWACEADGMWYYAYNYQRMGVTISSRLYRYIHR